MGWNSTFAAGFLGICLAGPTKVGGTAAQDDAGDGVAANQAGFGGAVVDLVDFLEFAGGAVGVAVIAEGAAFVFDGAREDGFDRTVQACDLVGRQAAGGA